MIKQKPKIINKTFLQLDDEVININQICRIRPFMGANGNITVVIMTSDTDQDSVCLPVTASVHEIAVVLQEMDRLGRGV